jgi:3-oxoadipate enol-lactonase
MTTLTLHSVVDGDLSAQPVIILGNSLGATTHAWGALVPLLTDHFAVVRFDLPGHGESPVADQSFTLTDLAAAVIALADSLGVDTFDYAGVSVCGGLALELAYRYPDRIRHAAAVCTSAYFGGAEPNETRAALVRREGSASQVAGLAERWFSVQSRATQRDLVTQFERMVADTSTEGYAQVVEALGTYDARGYLADIRVPVLVISGDEDPGTTPAAGAEIAAGVPGATQIVIADGAHQAAAEHPEQAAAALLEFFRK